MIACQGLKDTPPASATEFCPAGSTCLVRVECTLLYSVCPVGGDTELRQERDVLKRVEQVACGIENRNKKPRES